MHATIVAFATGLISIQYSSEPPKPKVLELGDLLVKTAVEFDKAFGTPKKTGSDIELDMEWKTYPADGTVLFKVYFDTGTRNLVRIIELSFKRDVKWQKAIEVLGLKPEKVKATPMLEIPGMSQLIGEPYKNWNVYFTGSNGKYPGGDTLVNSNGGLPMISFEQRSINDDSPD